MQKLSKKSKHLELKAADETILFSEEKYRKELKRSHAYKGIEQIPKYDTGEVIE